MSSKAGILAYNQEISDRPQTHMRKEDAEFLASHMRLERISRKLYRALPPSSVFPSLGSAMRRPGMQAQDFRAISIPNPFGGELSGCKFVLNRTTPENDLIAKVRRIPRREQEQAIYANG